MPPPRLRRGSTSGLDVDLLGLVLEHRSYDGELITAAFRDLVTGKIEPGRSLGQFEKGAQPGRAHPKHDPADTRPEDRRGAHRAGLGTGVKRRSGEDGRVDAGRSIPHGIEFSMAGDIA